MITMIKERHTQRERESQSQSQSQRFRWSHIDCSGVVRPKPRSTNEFMQFVPHACPRCTRVRASLNDLTDVTSQTHKNPHDELRCA